MDSIRRSGTPAPADRPAHPRSRAVGVAIALGLATSMAAARPTDDKPRAIVLFDGKSLDGWSKTDFTRPGEVKVEDGAIVLGLGRPMTGITSNRKDLPRTDFELSFEAMRRDGSDFFAAATFPVGDGYITLVNGGWGGNVTGLSSIDGVDASENETTTFVKYQDKTWYRFRIRVTAAVIRCWIDDKLIVRVEHQDRQVRTRIEVRANEPLGFAAWESSGAVRKIELRKLTPAEVAATNKTDD
jgi:hypothetical protein